MLLNATASTAWVMYCQVKWENLQVVIRLGFGDGHGILQGTILASIWREWGKSWINLSGEPITQQRFEPDTSWIRSKSTAATPTLSVLSKKMENISRRWGIRWRQCDISYLQNLSSG